LSVCLTRFSIDSFLLGSLPPLAHSLCLVRIHVLHVFLPPHNYCIALLAHQAVPLALVPRPVHGQRGHATESQAAERHGADKANVLCVLRVPDQGCRASGNIGAALLPASDAAPLNCFYCFMRLRVLGEGAAGGQAVAASRQGAGKQALPSVPALVTLQQAGILGHEGTTSVRTAEHRKRWRVFSS
jgi:hypothetical protein